MLTVSDEDGESVDKHERQRVRISRRWTIAAAAVAALVVGATSLASSTAPPNQARALGELFFNNRMARAEVVMMVRGSLHDFRIDQGRVVSVRPGAIELLEVDGTRQLVPVAATAEVLLNGRVTLLTSLSKGVRAITIRDGEQPAYSVRATGRDRGQGKGKKP
jgi:hypothetical protein